MGWFRRIFGTHDPPDSPSRNADTMGGSSDIFVERHGVDAPDGVAKAFREYDPFRAALDESRNGCDPWEWSEHLGPFGDIDAKARTVFERRRSVAGGDAWIRVVWHKNNPSRLRHIDACVQVTGHDFVAVTKWWEDPSPHLGLSDSTKPQRTIRDVGIKGRLEQSGSTEPLHNEIDYFEVKLPTGAAACSDNQCPCPGTRIPRGGGFLYIDQELVNFRRDVPTIADMDRKLECMKRTVPGALIVSPDVYLPILMCKEGARLRGLDLDVAAADAQRMWETGKVPLRATPRR